ncbi:hypothetical protein [Caldimonas brevitalea]|uniref:Uncharacterized protein n=1 Tax=Caldimonas brevitalea TaxID=413882 RepID=A0A0G3BHG2_9BURK|nr:hypothetical protein [Caldimonas brevitalea]AKJ28767.1 hypothetical protein AAW51_2076 [Caldimonas brevitalea]
MNDDRLEGAGGEDTEEHLLRSLPGCIVAAVGMVGIAGFVLFLVARIVRSLTT